MLLESMICLALNVYHEAKNQSYVGQVAVAQVVMNRVRDTRYPNTVCDVVKQGATYKWRPEFPIKNRCQFSWYCDGKPDTIRDGDAWRQAQIVAYRITYNERHRGLTEGATHYHADYVHPKWASTLQLVGRIATHIFYRWP